MNIILNIPESILTQAAEKAAQNKRSRKQYLELLIASFFDASIPETIPEQPSQDQPQTPKPYVKKQFAPLVAYRPHKKT